MKELFNSMMHLLTVIMTSLTILILVYNVVDIKHRVDLLEENLSESITSCEYLNKIKHKVDK